MCRMQKVTRLAKPLGMYRQGYDITLERITSLRGPPLQHLAAPCNTLQQRTDNTLQQHTDKTAFYVAI